MRIIHIIALLLITALLNTAAGIANVSEQGAKARLESVQTQIRKLRSKRAKTKGESAALQAELARMESKIGRINRQIVLANREQSRLNEKEQLLEQRKDNLQTELDKQKVVLGEQLRAAYAMGRQQKIKLLLNQQEPSSIGRTLMYFDYLNKNRSDQISQLQLTLAELLHLEREISENRLELSRLHNELQVSRRKLEDTRKDRRKTLHALRQELQSQGEKLTNLLVDEQELQQVIKEIQLALADIPKSGNGNSPFKELKGKLSWPTLNPVGHNQSRRHGTARGQLKWHGVLIDAKTNQSVHAVSRGRVAFADWMRGYGLLIIIDHGQNYMSLYGHNQSLYRDVGDWVESGDMISTVGDSGGQSMPGLYFEIRHKGKPIDPVAWFSSKFKVSKNISK